MGQLNWWLDWRLVGCTGWSGVGLSTLVLTYDLLASYLLNGENLGLQLQWDRFEFWEYTRTWICPCIGGAILKQWPYDLSEKHLIPLLPFFYVSLCYSCYRRYCDLWLLMICFPCYCSTQVGSQPITSVAWLPVLRMLVTVSKDGTLQVWKTRVILNPNRPPTQANFFELAG